MIRQQPTQFELELEQAVAQLRAAFIQVFDDLRLDAHAPQELSRRLGLNKTLTWNISRTIRATDHFGALPHIPGEQALGKFIDAVTRCGASDEAVANIRSAMVSFKEMTAAHVGDRASLDLMVDSMVPTATDSIEASRKLAFRGNSGLYGIQARTRIVSSVVVPNAENPSMLDVAFLSGFVGLRRLRPNVRWPIFKVRLQSAQSQTTDLWSAGSPADADNCDGPRCFSKGPSPEIKVVNLKGEKDYILMPGAVGDTAAFDCFKGDVFRAAVPRFRSREGETGDFGASITVPAEHLVLDLIAHEDLEFALRAEMVVFSTIYAAGESDRSNEDVSVLPIRQRPVELIGTPLAVGTSRAPRYSEFFRTMHERLGVDPTRLRGIRVEMKYPPLGAMVLLRYPLPAGGL